MAVSDAVTARGMAQRILAAVPGISQNFVNQNALLKILIDRGQVKWGGSHIEFDWFIRKEPDASKKPSWGGGELGLRTFEESDPANKAVLPYCYLEKTYGVGERTLEANRHASGRQKIYDSLKENLNIAKISLYNRFGPTIFDGDGKSNTPSGIVLAMGSPYETTDNVTVAAAAAYAGRTLTTAGVTAYNADRTTAGWNDEQFAPLAIDVVEIPGVTAWSTGAVLALAFMADEMALTADISGTGEQHKPDIAIMNRDPYNALKKILTTSVTTYNIPVGNEKLLIAGWANIQVDTLTCIKDNNVPDDSGSKERVLIGDTKQMWIHTTHTKAEGLIRSEFDADSVLVPGAIGVLKMNLQFRFAPTALGCVTGCDA